MKRTYLSRLEGGRLMPTFPTLKRLAKHCKWRHSPCFDAEPEGTRRFPPPWSVGTTDGTVSIIARPT